MIKKPSKTKSEKSLTPLNETKNMDKKASGPVIWSIRNVDPETRRLIEKASARLGKTLGQYLNEDVRAYAQSKLTQTQLPASPKNIQDQIDHLTKIIEGMSERMPEPGRKSLWKRLFN